MNPQGHYVTWAAGRARAARDPITWYWIGRRCANLALGTWFLASVAALVLLLALVAGCGWRPTLNDQRPGVTWTAPPALDALDAHAEAAYPVAYRACLNRKECR